MIQQTSLNAFNEIQPNLGEKQQKVYLMLKDLSVANNLILAKKLNWPINTVTPRVLELRQKGLIVKDSLRPCPISHRITWFWRCLNDL